MVAMTLANVLPYGGSLVASGLLVRPVGGYLARVFSSERTWLDPVLTPLERGIYRLAGVDPAAEMDWKRYAGSFVAFGLGGTVLLYVVLRIQPFLHRFDPAYLPGPLAPDLAMNSATCARAASIFSSDTAIANPPLSRSARRMRKSPIAAGTRMPAAMVCAFSHGVAVSAPESKARTIGAQPSDCTAMRWGKGPSSQRSSESSCQAFHMPMSPVPPPVG